MQVLNRLKRTNWVSYMLLRQQALVLSYHQRNICIYAPFFKLLIDDLIFLGGGRI